MPPFLNGGDMIGAVHEHKATWAEGPRKFEAGTRNVGGEVGFAAAIEYMNNIGWEAMEAHEYMLLNRMLSGMRAMPWRPFTASRWPMAATASSASTSTMCIPTMWRPFWMRAA